MSLGVFAVVMLIIAAVDAIRRRSVSVSLVALGFVALVLELLPVAEVASYALLLAAFGALFLAPILLGRAFNRAVAAGDQASVVRLARLGHLVTNNPEWTTRADMRAWRVAAETDVEGARPLLERAAYRRSHSQPYNMLVLEAAYGHVDVPALIDQRWAATPKSLRPLLLHLAVTVLVETGRSADALTRLGRATAAELTPVTRRLVLAEIAAATGDRDTLEALVAHPPPFMGAGRPEVLRAIAERARGDVGAADRRLRSLDVPPGGWTARLVARCLQHPTPVFDEAALGADAGRGLALYRDLVRTSVSAPKPSRR